jgi:hypothetical protein
LGSAQPQTAGNVAHLISQVVSHRDPILSVAEVLKHAGKRGPALSSKARCPGLGGLAHSAKKEIRICYLLAITQAAHIV